MKFLIDAQLPKRLVRLFASAGHDAVHTLELPHGNRTTDNDIISTAERDDRIVVTKDEDFAHSYMIASRPSRLLLVTTGNIPNAELQSLLQAHLGAIVRSFHSYRFVELARDALIVHE